MHTTSMFWSVSPPTFLFAGAPAPGQQIFAAGFTGKA
jgi:hypothetical protein